jgi:hypothetical protein
MKMNLLMIFMNYSEKTFYRCNNMVYLWKGPVNRLKITDYLFPYIFVAKSIKNETNNPIIHLFTGAI